MRPTAEIHDGRVTNGGQRTAVDIAGEPDVTARDDAEGTGTLRIMAPCTSIANSASGGLGFSKDRSSSWPVEPERSRPNGIFMIHAGNCVCR